MPVDLRAVQNFDEMMLSVLVITGQSCWRQAPRPRLLHTGTLLNIITSAACRLQDEVVPDAACPDPNCRAVHRRASQPQSRQAPACALRRPSEYHVNKLCHISHLFKPHSATPEMPTCNKARNHHVGITAGEQRLLPNRRHRRHPAPHPRQRRNRQLARRRRQSHRTPSGGPCPQLRLLPPVHRPSGESELLSSQHHDLRKPVVQPSHLSSCPAGAARPLVWKLCAIGRCCIHVLLDCNVAKSLLVSVTGAVACRRARAPGCQRGTAPRHGASALAPARR